MASFSHFPKCTPGMEDPDSSDDEMEGLIDEVVVDGDHQDERDTAKMASRTTHMPPPAALVSNDENELEEDIEVMLEKMVLDREKQASLEDDELAAAMRRLKVAGVREKPEPTPTAHDIDPSPCPAPSPEPYMSSFAPSPFSPRPKFERANERAERGFYHPAFSPVSYTPQRPIMTSATYTPQRPEIPYSPTAIPGSKPVIYETRPPTAPPLHVVNQIMEARKKEEGSKAASSAATPTSAYKPTSPHCVPKPWGSNIYMPSWEWPEYRFPLAGPKSQTSYSPHVPSKLKQDAMSDEDSEEEDDGEESEMKMEYE